MIYYDPSHDVRSPTIFGPHDILFKRSAFSWEQEYRFWFDDGEVLDKIEAGEEPSEKELSDGLEVGITNMKQLVRKIVVGPGASDEMVELVRAACAKYHKLWLCNVIERSYSDRMWDSFTR